MGARTDVRGTAVQESIAGVQPDASSRVLDENVQSRPLGGVWKRAFDIAMAGVALLVLMPLVLATAILIRLLTEESIMRCEQLIGHRGKTFVGYRFRIAIAKVTTFRWASGVVEALRVSALDKLPQLFNVIRGDMSLVGPRPRAAAEVGDYCVRAPECLIARPGFISIWQSFNPALSDRDEIALDRYYVRNWSARLDFAILGRALFVVHQVR